MRVPRSVYLFLAVGLVAASQSGNLIRLGQAHPVAITAWRLLLATLLLSPLAWSQRRYLKELDWKDALLMFGAGAGLATHFFAWIAAVQLTTVANAAVFFSINPVVIALGGWLLFGERVGPRLWGAIALGLAGVAVVASGDFQLRPEHLKGDLSSVVCALLFAVYFFCGKQLRKKLPSRIYLVGVYGTACVVSFVTLLTMRIPVTGYSQQTWLCFVLMALVPTMIGHSSLNHALRYIPVARISVLTLSEPIFAGVVAFFVWSEPVGWQTGLGYTLICLSVVVLVTERAPEPAVGEASDPTVGEAT